MTQHTPSDAMIAAGARAVSERGTAADWNNATKISCDVLQAALAVEAAKDALQAHPAPDDGWLPIEESPHDGLFWACIKHGNLWQVVVARRTVGGVFDVQPESCVSWRPSHNLKAYYKPLIRPQTTQRRSVMETPTNAKWSIEYDDGSEKASVSYDTKSTHRPRLIDVHAIGDGIAVLSEDAAWVAARLLDAAAAINARLPEEPNGEGSGDG